VRDVPAGQRQGTSEPQPDFGSPVFAYIFSLTTYSNILYTVLRNASLNFMCVPGGLLDPNRSPEGQCGYSMPLRISSVLSFVITPLFSKDSSRCCMFARMEVRSKIISNH
jgi:hypothetical protein